MTKRILAGSFFLMLVGLSLAVSIPADAQNDEWGTVKGRVIWDKGPPPVQAPIAAAGQNADCKQCLIKNPVLSDEWVVNPKNKGIQWTFVWLVDQNPKKALPIHPKLKALPAPQVVIDQPCCAFIPHAVGLREGQVLVAKNSAAFAHNFKWAGNQLRENNVGGNFLMPAGAEVQIKNLEADRFPIIIECNIHPWMKAYARVFNHPYYAVTDKDGGFELKDAPAGDYRLVMWHGSAGWNGGGPGKNGQPISIKASTTTDLGDIAFKDPPPPK